MCVPLSGYLNSQLGAVLPLALTAALATVAWPQGLSFNLGVISPGGSINALPLIQQLELGTAAGGTFWDMTACGAQVQVTATILLPSITMTLASPAVLSLAVSGTMTAWVTTNAAGETLLTALSATSLGLAPNPFAGGQTVVGAVNADPASTSLATLLTALLQPSLATALINQVLGAVLPLPLSLGAFSLCAPSASYHYTGERGHGYSLRAAANPLFAALSTFLQSQLNGGLWSTIAGSVGFTLGGNASKIDPLVISGVVSGSGGGGSCGGDCIDGVNTYGRGAGDCSCPGGWTNMGTYCYQWWPPNSQSCNCGPGEENWGSLCYPVCEAGYAPAGCCICAEQVQMCAGGLGGFQLGSLAGLGGMTFNTFAITASPTTNTLTLVANVSGTVTLQGGSAWGSAAVFEVPCGQADNWQQYIPHEVSIDIPAISVPMTATVSITVPWTTVGPGPAPPSPYAPPPIAGTMVMLNASSTNITNIAVDPWDWASIVGGVPGLSELAGTINGKISSVLNGVVASAIPTDLLSSLGPIVLPFPVS